jgi:hypothetical protein
MTIENRECSIQACLRQVESQFEATWAGSKRKHGGDGEACGLTVATLVPAVRFVLYGAAVRVGSSSVAVTSGHKGSQSTMLTEGSVSSHRHFAASRVAKLVSSLQISCVNTAQVEVPAGPFSKKAFCSVLHRRSCVTSRAFWTRFCSPRAEEKATGAWIAGKSMAWYVRTWYMALWGLVRAAMVVSWPVFEHLGASPRGPVGGAVARRALGDWTFV